MKLISFDIPEQITVNGKKLQLNGAAVRTKFFINTYILAFYTEKPITNSDDAVNSSTPRVLRMLISTPMATPKLVSESIEKGVKERLGNKYAEVSEIVESIKGFIESSNVGYKDYIDNFYDNDDTLYFLKNDNLIHHINTEASNKFIHALFDMYIGNKPKDEKIKKALLKGW